MIANPVIIIPDFSKYVAGLPLTQASLYFNEIMLYFGFFKFYNLAFANFIIWKLN